MVGYHVNGRSLLEYTSESIFNVSYLGPDFYAKRLGKNSMFLQSTIPIEFKQVFFLH